MLISSQHQCEILCRKIKEDVPSTIAEYVLFKVHYWFQNKILKRQKKEHKRITILCKNILDILHQRNNIQDISQQMV